MIYCRTCCLCWEVWLKHNGWHRLPTTPLTVCTHTTHSHATLSRFAVSPIFPPLMMIISWEKAKKYTYNINKKRKVTIFPNFSAIFCLFSLYLYPSWLWNRSENDQRNNKSLSLAFLLEFYGNITISTGMPFFAYNWSLYFFDESSYVMFRMIII